MTSSRWYPSKASSPGRAGVRGADAIRVAVVADRPLIRAGLTALLSAAPGTTVVGQAGLGDDATNLVRSVALDVLLLDVPALNGRDVAGVLAAPGRDWQLVVLTTLDSDEQTDAALEAGAVGILARDTPPRQLFHAIHAIAAGGNVYASTVGERLRRAHQHRHRPAPVAAQALQHLTTRELEVLRLVATGLPNRDIADRLCITEATVKTHLNRAMTKLELSSRAQAVVVAYETGLTTPRNVIRTAS